MPSRSGCPYGSHRAQGGMPQPAPTLDATMEAWDNEILLDVELLNLDSSSMRQIAEEQGGSEEAIGRRILEIVRSRGKMHNPVTGSGGVLVGRVREVGPAHPARRLARPLRAGDRVCPSISLSLIPLVLDAVHGVNIATTQVRVSGRAILFESANLAVLPDDFGVPVAIGIIDVCGAPTSVHRLLAPGQSAAILGAGKAGLLCAVAAREALGPDGRLAVFDVDEKALGELASLGVADDLKRADMTDPIAVYETARAMTDGRLFDTVINVTNVPGTEVASILATRQRGSIFFFGMATNFQVAALSAEGAGKDVTMVIGNGFAEGCIEFGLDLVRRIPTLRAILERRLA